LGIHVEQLVDTPKHRFEALDGLRGVAAILVVIFHANIGLETTYQPLAGGYLSVDLFFVLSGFVIALSYESRLRRGMTMPEFLRVRSARLIPVHICAMIIVIAATLAAYFGGHLHLPGISAAAILIAGTLNIAFIPDPISPVAAVFAPMRAPFPINPVLWSLWDEWVVNLIYTRIFGMRTRIVAFAAVLLLALTAWIAFELPVGWQIGTHHADFLLGIVRALGDFSAGIVVYRLYQKRLLQRLPSIRPEILYVFWFSICVMPVTGSRVIFDWFAAMVLAPLIVALLVRGERTIPKVFQRFGALSYPLYTSHNAVLILSFMVVDDNGYKPPIFLGAPLILAVALCIAWLVAQLSNRLLSLPIAGLRPRWKTT
jgi:peptidoglycan/LPS O-acetylase OafA/YrhL